MKSTSNALEIDLSRFSKIGLSSLGQEHLLDRVDTKFATHTSCLSSLLPQLESSYQILVVEDSGIQPYRNLYFDDEKLSFYFHHHDKKGNRCKVRLREYSSTGTIFFEIKQKVNKNRTIKQRVQHIAFNEALSPDAQELLQQHVPPTTSSLRSTLWCDFNRITLLSPNQDERMTIDYNIKVRNTENAKEYSGLALIEIKHASSGPSSFDAVAKKNGIKKISISKYIMGVANLHPQLKQNNFRMKLLAIEKIMNKTEAHHGI
ncbi:MAG TPA: polyphosphate polymerase domain-containing protein [Chryseolinea sp.]|nr:polyphosphate polymerase domain-containing protein [Chryseolinea sp.]HPH45929.1 polyphosphate polymerase domain-containing protein [Chryseolinea sp.]HPM29195.1 polyphosphate polymerase domain-containing protein [Chryseolinea sp.]